MKKLVVALSIALLGAGIGALYLWQELDELHGQVASLQTRAEALETLKPASATSASQVQAAAVTTVPTVAPPPAAKETTPTPEVPVTLNPMMRNVMTQMYPDLGQELDLRPEELEKLLDLLTSEWMKRGANPMDAPEKAVAAMLGNKYAQWQEYQKTLPGRQQVTQLRGQLAASGSALPEAQVRPLMVALTAEQQRIDADAFKNLPPRNANQQELMEHELQRAPENNRRLVEAATPYLSAPQLDSYRQMLERQVSMVRAMTPGIGAVQSQTGANN